MSWELFYKNKNKQPEKNVKCAFCGKNINLKNNYGHYTTTWDNRYKCEKCYYNDRS